MPFSGEMRLRQLILALIALCSIWAGVYVERSQHAPARAAFTAGPAPPDFPAPQQQTKLVRVPGLKRPVAATPIVVKAAPQQYVHASGRTAKTVKTIRAKAKAKPASKPASGTELVDEDRRNYAEAPPPPLEPLAIENIQVSALTSSSARVTWQTNVPTV